MRSSETIGNLATSLIAAQSEFTVVEKDKKNAHHGYQYASLEAFITATREILIKNKLTIVSSNPETEFLPDRVTRDGKVTHAVKASLAIRLIHTSGEWLEINVTSEGQSHEDKAIYKAITGGRKYGIASILNLATKDDPELVDDTDKNKNKNRTTSYSKSNYDNNQRSQTTTTKPQPAAAANAKPAPAKSQAEQTSTEGGLTRPELSRHLNGIAGALNINELNKLTMAVKSLAEGNKQFLTEIERAYRIRKNKLAPETKG